VEALVMHLAGLRHAARATTGWLTHDE